MSVNDETDLRALLAQDDWAQLPIQDALIYMARLVNLSNPGLCEDTRGSKAGLDRADEVKDLLLTRQLDDRELALVHYFHANALNGCRLARKESDTWESEALAGEILHLRIALRAAMKSQTIDKSDRCRMLTNLGNALHTSGRIVECIENWDKALEIDAEFGMARGNRAVCFDSYAQHIHRHAHKAALVHCAHRDAELALTHRLERGRSPIFEQLRDRLAADLEPGYRARDLDTPKPPTGSAEEIRYRDWGARHRLFLTEINDLPIPVLGMDFDDLTLPPIVTGINEGPYYIGFFNQLKQEYASARYMLFQGITEREAHFSDKHVAVADTLDYPSYSLSSERLRMAFRSAHSLLDKDVSRVVWKLA